MKPVLVTILLLATTGCLIIPAPEAFDFEAPFECQTQLGPVYFEYAITPRGCQYLDENISAAKAILIEQGHLTDREFRDLFEGMPIKVRDAEQVDSDGHKGYYHMLYGIVLNRHTRSLIHEMFHGIEASEWNVMTGKHNDWTKKGYRRDIKAYLQLMRNPYPDKTMGYRIFKDMPEQAPEEEPALPTSWPAEPS